MLKPLEDLSVVLPVYNEATSIESVLRALVDTVRACAVGGNCEFVVAEDGSTDGTAELLRRLAPELGLRLVQGSSRKGYSRAVKDALAEARHDWIFFTDSDGQHEPDDLRRLAEVAESTGADIVTGVKSPRRDPWPRLVLSAGLAATNRVVMGAHLADANCGFRLMRRERVAPLAARADKLPLFVNTEILLRARAAGLRIEEVRIRHYPRPDGGSRGLPAARIPGEVLRLLRGMVRLRRELATDLAKARGCA
jgi:glycosyltransferase involved in cell wall biosynthesis